jgi:hypothetical protein
VLFDETSTHEPLHSICEPVQPVPHAAEVPEETHTGSDPAHVVPHAPQLPWTVRSSGQPGPPLQFA